MINSMVSLPDANKRDLTSLRFSTSAGEALPAELYHRWKETFGSEVLDFIGSAELYHGYISNRIDDVKAGSLGKVVPGYEAKVFDAQGVEVPYGEVGYLWVRGGSAGLGYWHAYEKTRETFQGEWVNTGDLFKRDHEGYFLFAGREGDVLKVGGIFVAPLEIENCLLTHQAIKECAVIGAPDAQALVKHQGFYRTKRRFQANRGVGKRNPAVCKNHPGPLQVPAMGGIQR